MTRALLTTECVVEMYNMRGWTCSGLDSVGRCWRYYFRLLKAFCYSSPHSTFVEPLNMLKKGRLLSASYVMNLFKAGMWPVNFCTSFLVCRGCIWRMALIFFGSSFDAFGGDQTTKYFTSCHSKNTLVWVQLELGFTHVGESFRQVRNVSCFLFTRHNYIIDVREHISANLVF
jgi:hypothetical protein